LERVLSDPDIHAVAIATPVSTHFELGRLSLTAGKHTFIEKPMARTSDECRKLIGLAESYRLTLMVGHTFVYNSAVRKMKEIIDSGEIGKVLYIGCQRLNLGLFQQDINVAWDLAPHDISIILYLLGQGPESVSCQGKAHLRQGVEDVTNMSLSFESGPFATIQSSWLDPNKVRRMTVVGENKMIVYEDTEPLEKLKVYDKRVEVPRTYDTFAEFFYSYHYGGVYSPFIEQDEPLRVECRRFLDSIRNGAGSESEGRHGLEVVRVLEAASHSLANRTAAVSLS
jgi:predicted dehydrogenase